jgi:hypothetical protein
LHYEKKDANIYAAWNVDYLKYDNCYSDGTMPAERYPIMRDALNATGRPIFYSMCGMFMKIAHSCYYSSDRMGSGSTSSLVKRCWQ